ncbi:MAG: hypothetical protein WCK36_04320, partial [Candidatus Firestonebacteria bacterium]
KYGNDKVAQIGTFGTMMAKAVIRDAGRALGMAYADVDKIAKLVPTELKITLEHAMEKEPELRNLYKSDPKIAQLIDTSMVLEGLTRHASTHAAGIVIGAQPLVNYVPLYKVEEGQITTAYPMGSLEKIGLLKMDLLGLRTLTVIDEAVKIIKRVNAKEYKSRKNDSFIKPAGRRQHKNNACNDNKTGRCRYRKITGCIKVFFQGTGEFSSENIGNGQQEAAEKYFNESSKQIQDSPFHVKKCRKSEKIPEEFI